MGRTRSRGATGSWPSAKLTAATALWLLMSSFRADAFDLQGHRGARGLMPENTLAGFAHALTLGVTTLEMDLAVSRDGHVVLSHDSRLAPALTRGPDGKWLQAPGPAINSLSLDQLKSYDIGRLDPDSRYARRFPQQHAVDGERIPTLAQVLALAPRAGNSRVHLNIETKLSPLEPHMAPSPEEFARILVEQLRGAGATGRVNVQSFDWRTLQHVQSLAPELKTAYLTAEQQWLDNVQAGQPGVSPWTAGIDVDDFGGSIPRMIKQAGGDIWSPYFRDLHRAQLDEAKALGLRVIVWTVNDVPDMHRLMDLGVDGIISDYPDRLREVVRQRGVAPPGVEKGG
ncbi:MAG: glycerophosphodiester phosphodiesterase [Gammaproteobacteria bacterium]|nr:glycerophosphodiester phosphodiesterase [Gammaproteobacteria bacterium]